MFSGIVINLEGKQIGNFVGGIGNVIDVGESTPNVVRVINFLQKTRTGWVLFAHFFRNQLSEFVVGVVGNEFFTLFLIFYSHSRLPL